MNPEFRFAEEADIPALTTLINTAFQVEKFFKIGERTDERDIGEHLKTGRFLLLGPTYALIGCVYVELRGSRGYIGMLSVAQAQQRQGLGHRLMAAAEDFCLENHCHTADLTVVDLRTELPPLYERMGYRVTGSAPFPTDEMPVLIPCGFVTMSKPLSHPDSRNAASPSTATCA